MPVLQPVTGTSDKPLTIGAASQYPDSGQADPTSPCPSSEEEGEMSDQQASIPEQNSDKQISEEQSY